MPNINLTCLTIYFCSEPRDSCVSLCTTLNEKVGFKYLLRAIAIIILCAVRYTVVPQIGLPVWGGPPGL